MLKAKLIGHNTNWELTIIVKHRKHSSVQITKLPTNRKGQKGIIKYSHKRCTIMRRFVVQRVIKRQGIPSTFCVV